MDAMNSDEFDNSIPDRWNALGQHANLITFVDKTPHYLSNLITLFFLHMRKSMEFDWLNVLFISPVYRPIIR